MADDLLGRSFSTVPVVPLPPFINDAKELMISPRELRVLADYISVNPLAGEDISRDHGAKGMRVLRWQSFTQAAQGALNVCYNSRGSAYPVYLISVQKKEECPDSPRPISKLFYYVRIIIRFLKETVK